MHRARPRPLAGQTVVITGAASGIGRALAVRLSAAGSPVAIVDKDIDGLHELAADLPGPVLAEQVDVSDRAAQMAFAARVATWMPRPIGAVFNNAGVAVSSTVAHASVEDDEWLLSINVGGVVNGVRAFLPILLEQGSGALVTTSSVYGLVAVPNHSAYCASKFAVRGFTESLRHELAGTGVRAVTVHPGGIRTNIARNGRTHGDPKGLGRSHEEQAAQFEAMVKTTPEHAAEVIHRGLDAGRARILIGADASLVDLASRLAPTGCWPILQRLESLLERTARR
jgi:NADP-dependent 3-hydroxy acid dehydrogenase YdfG